LSWERRQTEEGVMGRKTQIAIVTGVAVLLLAALGAYAYDSSQRNTIADGVRIGGVDVGGLDASEATRTVRSKLLAPLRHSLEVDFRRRHWKLPGRTLGLRADVDGAVEEAIAASRAGGLPGRLVRYVTGGSVEKRISPRIAYSRRAVHRFVRRVAHAVDREARDATVNPSGDSLEVVPAKNGRKLRDRRLTAQLNAAVLNANADRHLVALTHPVRPKLTTREVARQYPSYLTLDRATFTLRLWKDLKPVKSYTVAVGQEGLETPAGLYHIQEKQVNPSWHVPNSAWAGSLAGQVIPPGPADPIKARWMGIFEGAGIHGTEETWSLGSAVSHGCVRMSIPDVEELYDQVEVGTPIYIG
jgi:lipoprotein-anchoring transpeptidase ErfK/SrfK